MGWTPLPMALISVEEKYHLYTQELTKDIKNNLLVFQHLQFHAKTHITDNFDWLLLFKWLCSKFR